MSYCRTHQRENCDCRMVRITSFGRNLANRHGVTGVLTARLTEAEIDRQKRNAHARGEEIEITTL